MAGTAVEQEGHRFARLERLLVSLIGNGFWLLRDGGLHIAPTATEHVMPLRGMPAVTEDKRVLSRAVQG